MSVVHGGTTWVAKSKAGMSLSLGIKACLLRRMFTTSLRDSSSVRIMIGMIEHLLQLPDHFLTENVLDLFRITVDMVRGDAGFLREIQFPKSVVANDLCGALRSSGGQDQALGVQRAQAPRGERVLDGSCVGDTLHSFPGGCG